MNTQQWLTVITAIMAALSLASLLVTIHFSNRARKDRERSAEYQKMANQYAERANDIAVGVAENELLRDITSARRRFEDVSAEVESIVEGRAPSELSDQEKRRLKEINLRRGSSMEELLNTYENACSKYRDGKTDRDRFKKTYFSQIRNLFEPPGNAFRDLLHPEGTSRYKALWRVYKEWYDLE